ncbi:hypothetical protein AOLI_G00176670 [Acnodon oligacanthus]
MAGEHMSRLEISPGKLRVKLMTVIWSDWARPRTWDMQLRLSKRLQPEEGAESEGGRNIYSAAAHTALPACLTAHLAHLDTRHLIWPLLLSFQYGHHHNKRSLWKKESRQLNDRDMDPSEDESPLREHETGEGERSDEEDPDQADQDAELDEVLMPMLEECGITSVDEALHRRDWSPLQQVQQYIDDPLIRDLSVFTGQRMVQDSGCSLNTTSEEIKLFLGISVYVACLRYPRMKMSWATKQDSQ